MNAPRVTTHRVQVRYFEADQQGVVFNMWYFGYFDEAMAAFVAEGGLKYTELLAAGFDVQLVHTEIDWSGSLRWPDTADVEVSLAERGTTSFCLAFRVRCNGAEVAVARTVYVVVGTDGSGKCPIPPMLSDAIGTAPSVARR